MVFKFVRFKNREDLVSKLKASKNVDILVVPFSAESILLDGDICKPLTYTEEVDNVLMHAVLDCHTNEFINNIKNLFKSRKALLLLCVRLKSCGQVYPSIYVIHRGKVLKVLSRMFDSGYIRLYGKQLNIAVVGGLNIYDKSVALRVMKTDPEIIVGIEDDRVYALKSFLKTRYKNRLILCGSNRCYLSEKVKKSEKRIKNVHQYNVQLMSKNGIIK